MREFIIERKRDPEQEYTLHLFEYCNLRCSFCWQDHENKIGIETITDKLISIEKFLKTHILIICLSLPLFQESPLI